ncbi:MAG TPA: ferrochelatase [Polyangiaceae bacterium]|nr:ferrochelatase [Polyangiaceae bacterium]
MDGILLVAHGTIKQLDELPEFLRRIRRGREPSPELLAEMRRRYERIGGSPLLEITRAQASALEAVSSLPTLVAMRLWEPSVENVLLDAAAQGITRLAVLPLAPFSVDVYFAAALEAQKSLEGPAREIELVRVGPWALHAGFVEAQARLIALGLPTTESELVLTAHSLPLFVIRAGDAYADLVQACAVAIGQKLGRRVTLAYQSEGADGGQWLGPSLEQSLRGSAARGVRQVSVAPFGFLADHVETLYDLDIEARELAHALGLEWSRIPALNTDARFIAALAAIAQDALGR